MTHSDVNIASEYNISTPQELLNFLEFQKRNAEAKTRFIPETNYVATAHIRGMVFALNQAIEAVKILMKA